MFGLSFLFDVLTIPEKDFANEPILMEISRQINHAEK